MLRIVVASRSRARSVADKPWYRHFLPLGRNGSIPTLYWYMAKERHDSSYLLSLSLSLFLSLYME